jgi:hypothetical protein
MRTIRFVAPLVTLLALFASPQYAAAKAATIKIIISGPDLPTPLEITDDQILNLSNV